MATESAKMRQFTIGGMKERKRETEKCVCACLCYAFTLFHEFRRPWACVCVCVSLYDLKSYLAFECALYFTINLTGLTILMFKCIFQFLPFNFVKSSDLLA